MSKSSSWGDPVMLPRKITFCDGITRDILFAEKVVLCYKVRNGGAVTHHILGEYFLITIPTLERWGPL